MSDKPRCENCRREIGDDEDILELEVSVKGFGSKAMEVCEACARQAVEEMRELQRLAAVPSETQK